MKRAFDIVISGAAIIALGPLILALMAWIKLDSPGPALFRQTRIGRGGIPFEILKLRSMVTDAEMQGGYVTQVADPRITRAGALVRRTSLDELPQFFNVLRGDMSLVGPRPDTPMQESNYASQDWQNRHQVRPGITGLAQARLRSSATKEQRLSLDLEYAADATMRRDIIILFETVRTLFTRETV
ncbi:sugar transferase [Erythrobacter sp. Alg231-14]|uniref:sugar transferase n=1 Tax=Erythrobacter sp. Alg231-14 TaxID=1922225 RepID=UPI00307BE89B